MIEATNEALVKAYRVSFLDDKMLVLNDLAEYCNFLAVTYDLRGAEKTAFEEGKRSVFLHIIESMGITEIGRIMTALGTVKVEFKEEQINAETGEET